MSENYPTLKLMGITHPMHIRSYTLSPKTQSKDVLRIKYKRPSGSILSTTRSFEFDRIPKATDASPAADMTIFEIPPVLNEAIKELDHLLAAERAKASAVEDILNHLEEIERDFHGDVSHLRSMLEKLKTAE